MASKSSTAVVNPNLGLYLDRSPLAIPPGALQDGNNFRIQQGKLTNTNIGYRQFGTFTLNGPVNLVTTMHLRSGSDVLIFGTPTDLYKYNTGPQTVSFITPIYNTGTASTSGTAVTGVGTLWNTGTPTNAKAGDEISFGSASQTDPAATWYTIQTVNSNTSITLTTSAGVIGAGVYTIRRKFTGAVSDTWSFDTFVNAQPSGEDRIYLTNNGIDFPVQWNGIATSATLLSSIGFKCTSLCVYKNMMLYFNLLQGGIFKPTDFVNSDVSQPEVLAGGLASQFKVSGATDGITAAKRLGDYLVIYLKDYVILANFVGSPLVFVFRTAVEGKGMASPRGMAFYPDYHEFLSDDAMYAFDGSSARPVSNHVWREIIRIQDPKRIKNVFTVLDEHRGDYIWTVPLTTDPGAGTITSPPVSAYAEHYLETVPQGAERPHSKRAMPFWAAGTFQRQSTITWNQLTQAWNTYNFRWNDSFLAAEFPLILVGGNDGKVYELNGSQDANGTALPSFVKFGRRALMDGRNRALLTRVYPFVTQFTNNLTVTALMADHAAGPTTSTNTATFDQNLTEGNYFAALYHAGRYVDLQFGTNGPSQPYEISGYDWEVRKGGYR